MKRPTITTEQRDALYAEIIARLSGIGDVLTVIEREEFDKAQMLADEFGDYLRLLADDLGWGEIPSGTIELSSPHDLIQRAAKRLRAMAQAGDREMEEMRASVQEWTEQNQLVVRTCDQLLAEAPTES
jgi:hypothetical protein